jgi:hypothetical protein
MGLEKAIAHKKEYRRPYYGAKAMARGCRNHGWCEWCFDNRIYKYKKKEQKMLDRLKEWEYNR